MARQQLIEFGAVAPCHPRGVSDVALGNLQQLAQVVQLKLIARLHEGRQRRVLALQRLLNQRVADVGTNIGNLTAYDYDAMRDSLRAIAQEKP